MLMKFLVKRFVDILFPFSLKQICSKVYLWDKVIFEKSSICHSSVFEGYNTLQRGVICAQCNVGIGTYIGAYSNLYMTKIGRFCSIADNVKTGFGTHPINKFVTTFPAFYYETNNIGFSFFRATDEKHFLFNMYRYTDSDNNYLVEIGNDVWIGSHVLIMDGIKIGDGAVIAAGAVVTKDVAPYSVVGGVPAKLLKYRFLPEHIEFLCGFKWWEKSFEWIKEHYLDFESIDYFIDKYRN